MFSRFHYFIVFVVYTDIHWFSRSGVHQVYGVVDMGRQEGKTLLFSLLFVLAWSGVL